MTAPCPCRPPRTPRPSRTFSLGVQVRAAALNLVTAAIILFNCRYLGRAGNALRSNGTSGVEEALGQISPLGWDHINLTGDYVFSDNAPLDNDGFLPLKLVRE